ncbi:MAG TPA: glycoside hydrolase family 38 C-terminal domain-containing protein [Terracidiphilus sp.]|jgi:alpha-mannosidase|nr:glycoside hydrolase family 38 C-terminal domain-containing protein [Terracidiphilus sp.]
MGKVMGEVSRRAFLVRGTAATVGAVVAPALALQAGQAADKKVIHIIGHSHIDAAWLWPWRDGADTVLSTFRSALNRIKETPGFCYTHSSSAHYRWAERADPSMMDEIRQRIREGRWEVVGGWPVEPDCNIPATESFVRHCLYGKEFCQQTLGVDVQIGFNPDSFGHAAGLPTILKRAGYGYYAFMRPQEHEMKLPLLFWWEGPDGSRVLVSRIWHGYDMDAEQLRPAVEGVFASGFNHGAFFLGVGDHGGAVTKEQIAQVLALQKDSTLPELRFSTLREFFRTVEASSAFGSLPVVKGDLQHHARGCYSANGEGKYQNRRAERALVEAETISLAANWETGHAYPAQDYAESWWKVLFCQFHDMMAGTSLYSDYEDVRDSLGYACEVAQTEKVTALEKMAKRVDLSSVAEGAVFLFNPLPWRRKALAEFYTDDNPSGRAPVTHLRAKDGGAVPAQWRPSASMTPFLQRLSAWVELPPCGYKVFELAHGDAPAGEGFKGFATVSDTGFGISSFKAEDGAELLAGSMGLVVIGDTSDTWAHGINEFRLELGRPTLESSAVIENGAVTRVTRQRARWQDSEIVLDIAEFAGMDFIELRFVIDWRQKEQMLKLELPTALAQPRMFAKVPGAVLERRTNGEEEPYQDWGAVQGSVGGADYTVAILNRQTYSYDCLNGLFRTVLIRSAPFARHNPGQVPHNDNNAWQDQGRQERRFWLLGKRGPWSEHGLDRRAEELQSPAEFVTDSAHSGSEPWEKSLMEITPNNVWVPAMKQAEHVPGAVIVRLQERSGKATEAKLKSEVLGLDHAVSLAAFELKTVLITPGENGPQKNGPAGVREVSLLEA